MREFFISLCVIAVCCVGFSWVWATPNPSDPAGVPLYQTDWVDTGSFRYRVALNAEHLLIVDTTKSLTVDKLDIVRSAQEEKKLNEVDKDLFQRLLKINEVQGVMIANRRVEIQKFAYKTNWPSIMPEILKVLESTLK